MTRKGKQRPRRRGYKKPTLEIVLRRVSDPLESYYGSMTGILPPGYLRTLRDEWE